ncbi:SAVED domain-containing protein [Methylomonas methanica]|jgi:hypothetical protein|nr:SAVED domain-containing protein [Methylomonas methanica]
MNKIIHRLLDLLELYFRRSPAGKLVGTGALLMAAGSTFDVKLNFGARASEQEYVEGQFATADTEWWISAGCLAIGTVLIAIGLWFSWHLFQDQRRKRVIAIELRGLTQSVDTPLESAIPRRVLGARHTLLIDVRNQIDGTKNQRQAAIDLVNLLPQQLKLAKDGRDRNDLAVYACGLAPVPVLFLAGTLLASESVINWMDWDRKELRWISPNDGADVGELAPVDFSSVNGDEIVCAMSISYPIDRNELTVSFPKLPIVELKLDGAYPGRVISEASIQNIMQQFMQAIAALQGMGVRKIHLALAAPSVLTMRLGSCYAPRNMPVMIVYQYQRAQTENPYAWGIEMPNSDRFSGLLVEQNRGLS